MANVPRKILIIRFSSIGDIVLTSPVLRSLRACLPDAELHFLTKKAFGVLVENNPHLDKVHLFDGDLKATVAELRKEGFDFVLDLHKSIRSRLLRLRLRVRGAAYPKDRWPVLLYTRFRIGRLPQRHTVDRYGAALRKLGCPLDGEGLEFFLPEGKTFWATGEVARHFETAQNGKLPAQDAPVAVVLGGGLATKKWPKEHFVALLDQLGLPVVLLGGPDEVEEAKWIARETRVRAWVAAGKYKLLDSAAIMRICRFVITHDTGFMHIAVAFGMQVYSLWGNTVPEFGFAPYKHDAAILEVKGLGCRPCSKLGHEKCPKGHFRCMVDLKPEVVEQRIQEDL